jgi:disulfide oxidoreductase YuzD
MHQIGQWYSAGGVCASCVAHRDAKDDTRKLSEAKQNLFSLINIFGGYFFTLLGTSVIIIP